MRVFCDSDGVLMHYNQQVFNMFGKWPSELADDDMWEMIKDRADEFWSTMPLKYGALELWQMIQPYNPIILTGCPKGHYEQAAAHKVMKAKEHFGDDVQIITCLSRNKPLHMEAPGDILIDDFSRNTRRWIKAGGRAVQYRTFEQAVADFKALIEAPYEEVQA